MPCMVCNEDVTNNDFKKCVRCSKSYHTLCIDFSHADTQGQEPSINWTCPQCLSKQPRSDNSNIPVRPSTPTSMADVTFNVTRRKMTQSRLDTLQLDPSTESLRSDIREIIREEMRNALQDTIGEIKVSISANLKEINDQISAFKDSMNFLSDEFDKLKQDNITYRNEIKQLKKENEMLHYDLSEVKGKFINLDQLSRASNIEIQCVPEYKSENVINIVKQIGRTVSVSINDNDIHYCARIAKLNADSTRPRSILTKFNSPRTRDSFLSAVLTYNKRNVQDKLNTHDLGFGSMQKSPVYVVENLSPDNKNLHAATRKRAKELKYKFVWVRGGRVYARKTETSDTVFIRNLDILHKLI
ncbi:hypothetical protein HW555_000675 [Spodoptera exigua]|uniref:PHD-type domain-containing protein n=1 Tax=Spodoptera exigua TaxID=7107 RepID=A0A835GUP9_SPOEX|nr:hypothetical protein HW555_000675 [Spodoptera exigua]